jgi:hypothetical protein
VPPGSVLPPVSPGREGTGSDGTRLTTVSLARGVSVETVSGLVIWRSDDSLRGGRDRMALAEGEGVGAAGRVTVFFALGAFLADLALFADLGADLLAFDADFLAPVFFAAFGAIFFAADFFAAFGALFFAADFLAADFFAAFGADFLAAVFFAAFGADFLAALFFAAFGAAFDDLEAFFALFAAGRLTDLEAFFADLAPLLPADFADLDDFADLADFVDLDDPDDLRAAI